MRRLVSLAMLTITVGLFALWWLLLGPSFLGGPVTYVMIRGQSMEPTLDGGDLAVVRRHDAYRPGDIVAFRVPEGEPGEGVTVIHRIVGETQGGFITQGDNMNGPDPWHPSKDDILGRQWFSVPGAGSFLAFLRQPLPLAALAGGLSMLMVLGGGQKTRRPPPVSPAAPSEAAEH